MNLARLRAERALTQADLAQRIGVTRPLISMIEGGKRSLTTRLARRIVEALDIPEDARAQLIGELVLEGSNAASSH